MIGTQQVGLVGKLAKFLGVLFAPMPSTLRPGELFSGVEKPTTTLAKMMAATLVEELPVRDREAQSNYDFEYARWTTSKFWINTQIYRPERERESWSLFKHSIDGVSFDANENAIIVNALKAIAGIQARRAAAEAAEKMQHKAIDAIANWVGVPETSGPDCQAEDGQCDPACKNEKLCVKSQRRIKV